MIPAHEADCRAIILRVSASRRRVRFIQNKAGCIDDHASQDHGRPGEQVQMKSERYGMKQGSGLAKAQRRCVMRELSWQLARPRFLRGA